MTTASHHRTKSNAPTSIAEQISSFQNDLLSHAYQLTKDSEQAWDLLQDTIERAIKYAHRFEVGTNLKAWTHQILRNLFISTCRRRALEQRTLRNMRNETDDRPAADAFRTHATTELSDNIQRSIDSLEPVYQAAVRLIDIQGYSYREAAKRMAVPVGTVMSRLHRARRLLAADCALRNALKYAA